MGSCPSLWALGSASPWCVSGSVPEPKITSGWANECGLITDGTMPCQKAGGQPAASSLARRRGDLQLVSERDTAGPAYLAPAPGFTVVTACTVNGRMNLTLMCVNHQQIMDHLDSLADLYHFDSVRSCPHTLYRPSMPYAAPLTPDLSHHFFLDNLAHRLPHSDLFRPARLHPLGPISARRRPHRGFVTCQSLVWRGAGHLWPHPAVFRPTYHWRRPAQGGAVVRGAYQGEEGSADHLGHVDAGLRS